MDQVWQATDTQLDRAPDGRTIAFAAFLWGARPAQKSFIGQR